MLPTRALLIATGLFAPVKGLAGTLAPNAVLPSALKLQIQATYRFADQGPNNIAAPVAIGDTLYVVDQKNGVGIWDGTQVQGVLDADDVPVGVTPVTSEAYLNIAGAGTTAFVAFTSSTVPAGITAKKLPDDPRFRTDTEAYQVVYRYTRQPDGSLVSGTPLAAFEKAQGHSGGGMLALPNGDLLFATGDNLSPRYNGLDVSQDPDVHTGKLLLIDGLDGSVETAAVGVRNVQKITFADAAQTEIAFADIGWTVAEEVNRIAVADLADTSGVENFGWGVAADGKAREGTFYVNEGPQSEAKALGEAPLGEPGFLQPYAQFGREDLDGFFAATGPLHAADLLPAIDLLFGDLVTGALYATMPGTSGPLSDVYRVALLDSGGQQTNVFDLTGRTRADLRLVTFAEGGAGLMFERAGTAYRLGLVAAVPVSSTGAALLSGLALLVLMRRTRAR